MKKKLEIRKAFIVCLALIFIGMSVIPAINGQTLKAVESSNQDFVTIGFGNSITKKISRTEWNCISNKLWTECPTIEDKITLLYENDLMPMSYDSLLKTVEERWQGRTTPRAFTRLSDDGDPILIKANMTGIAFNFSGITLSLGLNTLLRRINPNLFHFGMEITTFHIGEVRSNGLTIGNVSYDSGDYIGNMVGFLGFWAGDRIGYFSYDNLTVAGFTCFTTWANIDRLSDLVP